MFFWPFVMKYNNDITFSKRFTQFNQQSFHKQILDPLKIFISYVVEVSKLIMLYVYNTEVILNKSKSGRERL